MVDSLRGVVSSQIARPDGYGPVRLTNRNGKELRAEGSEAIQEHLHDKSPAVDEHKQ
jgi:hypothetical protein